MSFKKVSFWILASALLNISLIRALTYADYAILEQAHQAGTLPEVLENYKNNKWITPGEARRIELSLENGKNYRRKLGQKNNWDY